MATYLEVSPNDAHKTLDRTLRPTVASASASETMAISESSSQKTFGKRAARSSNQLRPARRQLSPYCSARPPRRLVSQRRQGCRHRSSISHRHTASRQPFLAVYTGISAVSCQICDHCDQFPPRSSVLRLTLYYAVCTKRIEPRQTAVQVCIWKSTSRASRHWELQAEIDQSDHECPMQCSAYQYSPAPGSAGRARQFLP